MMYHSEPNRSVPDDTAPVKSYTVRRLGHAAWAQNISTIEEAMQECDHANEHIARGHVVIAERADGTTRVVSREG